MVINSARFPGEGGLISQCPMKKLSSKVTLLASILAVASMFIVPAVRAADDDAAKAEKKKKKQAADLKKYDKNGNGKLDADEEAALKADVEKMKAEKKKKS
jgi:hypothetical protein